MGAVLTEPVYSWRRELAEERRGAIEGVIAAMRERPGAPFPLAEMAERACMSPYHFARVFKEVVGAPPVEFLASLRLERAKGLLLTTDLPVMEVCYEVGYESLGTFTTRFTRLVGVSPGRVRRLPAELDAALDRLGDLEADAPPPPWAHAPVAGVRVYARGTDLSPSLVFVGLFGGASPQGRPVAGAVLPRSGPFALTGAPDGRYHLLAAELPLSLGPAGLLLPGAELRVGRREQPVIIRGGGAAGPVEVELRPPAAADPPLLVSLGALLLERMARGARGG